MGYLVVSWLAAVSETMARLKHTNKGMSFLFIWIFSLFMPGVATPEALLCPSRAKDAITGRAAIDEYFVATVLQHPSASAKAKGIDSITQGRNNVTLLSAVVTSKVPPSLKAEASLCKA
ncbi:hypothetical protein [Duganella sp. Root1480D1]|uniref:hypothetical protein n=1 Tax=Duganella sp. Root1480D1 TaxID=1736471 RepID=UPI00070CFBC1|nr:hypothetical protein [Duganella sp. Root1480D1]